MKNFKARLVFVSGLLAVCFCVLICRLVYIQILNGDKYATRCREQSKRRTLVSARRGMIKDRRGVILAQSIESRLRIDSDGMSSAENNEKKDMRSVLIKRVYPYGELGGPVLGYIGTDGNGLAGIEYAYDTYLRGENGWSIIQKDGRNHQYSRIGMPQKIPENGCDVYLSIDVEIQKIVEKVLNETIVKYHAKGGMAIVMDPYDGSVLAMANAPSFNPNIWKHYSPDHRSNRCITCNYEPGSTFKVVTAAAVLQENITKEEDVIDGNKGVFEIYDQVIRDHKPYGMLTFSEALSYSSNVCFAKLALALGNKQLYKYTMDFGLGANTGIGLAGEESGIVHQVKDWSGRTGVTMAIGQEISVTLLQMLAVYATIANGGILVEPHICSRVVDMKGVVREKSILKAKRRVMSEQTALRMRKMLKGVVEYGTAKNCRLTGVSIAGKTGTSQKVDKETGAYSNHEVWASFIGFVPAEEPVLICGVAIDEPVTGDVGGVVAAPAFQQIFKQIISNPDLTYAERLITGEDTGSAMPERQEQRQENFKVIPDVCGMTKTMVSPFLNAEGIPFEFIGTGATVAYQSPSGGKRVLGNTTLILYTKEEKTPLKIRSSRVEVCVPNCVGKDLRDAVNVLSLVGLVPYVKGAGVVKTQEPGFGAMIRSMAVCTLRCSFDG